MSPTSPSGPKSESKSTLGLQWHFLIVLSLFMVVAAGSVAAYHLIPHDPMESIRAAQDSLDHAGLQNEYAKLVAANPTRMDYHYGYLQAHFAIPQTQVVGGRYNTHTIIRDDKPIEDQYNGYTQSGDPAMKDIGYYGVGFIDVRFEKNTDALACLSKVANPNLPYLNNSIGYIYLNRLKDPKTACGYFYKEIAAKGNVEGAVGNLAKLFWDQQDFQKLDVLAGDPSSSPYVPPRYLRYSDLKQGHWIPYLVHLFKSQAVSATPITVVSSLAIALMFVIYLYRVDFFEEGKVPVFLLTFVLGLFSGILALVFYDLAGCFASFHQTDDNLNNFFFFVFGVGLFEETAKAMPVLLVGLVLKKWKEPVDILVFASLSALGFACMENVAYFREAIGLIMPRTVSSVVFHVCLTTLAVYGLFYYRYKGGSKKWQYLFGCFGLAVLAHGLYDYFIDANFFGIGGYVSFFLVIYLIMMYQRMMENGLDQSPEARNQALTIHLSLYLFYGLLAIFLMQFALLTAQYGLETSGRRSLLNLLQLPLLALYVMSVMGQMSVIKGKWRPILDKYWWSSK